MGLADPGVAVQEPVESDGVRGPPKPCSERSNQLPSGSMARYSAKGRSVKRSAGFGVPAASSASVVAVVSSMWNPKWLKPTGVSPSSRCLIRASEKPPSERKQLPSGSRWKSSIAKTEE